MKKKKNGKKCKRKKIMEIVDKEAKEERHRRK